MEIKEARISILINGEYTTIELIDSISSTTFATIKLTPEQLSKALSRQAYVPCEIKVRTLDRLNKKMEYQTHEFEIPKNIPYDGRAKVLSELVKETLPVGWVSDNSFSSQNTFFEKDGKSYARTIIRRWV